jgi:hypothetical protein
MGTLINVVTHYFHPKKYLCEFLHNYTIRRNGGNEKGEIRLAEVLFVKQI